MRKLFVVGNEVGDINVAVVLLDEDIFSDLISGSQYQHLATVPCKAGVPVDEGIVEPKF